MHQHMLPPITSAYPPTWVAHSHALRLHRCSTDGVTLWGWHGPTGRTGTQAHTGVEDGGHSVCVHRGTATEAAVLSRRQSVIQVHVQRVEQSVQMMATRPKEGTSTNTRHIASA